MERINSFRQKYGMRRPVYLLQLLLLPFPNGGDNIGIILDIYKIFFVNAC
jgi:hypothetical protein